MMKKYNIAVILLMAVGVSNSPVKADCFFYANSIKDGCKGSKCKKGQCECRYF